MSGSECASFLQWALPRLGLRWVGFRDLRGQVCKRLARRTRELDLSSLAAYRAHLEVHAEEWPILETLCRVTISRFYRDGAVFDRLRADLLPITLAEAAARGERTVRAWSAGCASGEEAYTLAIAWTLELALRFPDLSLAIVATDIDDGVLRRAGEGCYPASSLAEMPKAWREAAFESGGGDLRRVRSAVKSLVELRHENLRETMPDGPFHLVFCRNLAFTYFDETVQKEIAQRLVERLSPGGLLVIGGGERLPGGVEGIAPCEDCPSVFRRAG